MLQPSQLCSHTGSTAHRALLAVPAVTYKLNGYGTSTEFAKAIVQRCIAMRQVSHESSTLSFKVLDAQDVSTPRCGRLV
jgi:hypothetical protein